MVLHMGLGCLGGAGRVFLFLEQAIFRQNVSVWHAVVDGKWVLPWLEVLKSPLLVCRG